MKTTLSVKKAMLFLVLLLITTALMAQSGDVVSMKITAFYRGFIRPVLIAWVVIQAAIGGIMANNKIRKNEEESSDAMLGWFKMILFPIVVLGVAELGTSIYQ